MWQVAGGAVAAVLAAEPASYFGVYGTIPDAGVVPRVVRTTEAQVLATAVVFGVTMAESTPCDPAPAPALLRPARPTPEPRSALPGESDALHVSPGAQTPGTPPRCAAYAPRTLRK